MNPAYSTLAEYQSLMLEAKIEFDAWEASTRKNKRANRVKHKALHKAKMEARQAFTDALDIEID